MVQIYTSFIYQGPKIVKKLLRVKFLMESLISIFVLLFLFGAISFLKPSKKMKDYKLLRMQALKEGFKIGSTNELRKKFKNWNPKLLYIKLKILPNIKIYIT